MRRIDLLVAQVRRSTENQDYSADAGIQDSEILQYFNDGQGTIETIIQNKFPDVMEAESTIDVIYNQEAYSIPYDAFLGNRVAMVEYSRNGLETNYRRLPKASKQERLQATNGEPIYYFRRDGKIYLQPKPQGGTSGLLRVIYQKAVPRLDIRRAKVGSVTLGSDSITSLVLDINEGIDDTTLVDEAYISIVDKDGILQMTRIPISAIDTTTGVVTVESGFTFDSGEVIAAGNYVVAGKYSTTHSYLPELCEKYLLEYVDTRLSIRDSSNDATALSAVTQKIEMDIMAAFSEPDADINLVPIISSEYLIVED